MYTHGGACTHTHTHTNRNRKQFVQLVSLAFLRKEATIPYVIEKLSNGHELKHPPKKTQRD